MTIRSIVAAMLAAASFAVSSAGAQSVRVVDGDTIKLDGTAYRLWGIDAPESRQVCGDGWEAGKESTAFMHSLVAGHTIDCEGRSKDRYGRTVALCRADGDDIQAAMVRAGMAWAFVRYSRDYVDKERAAVAAGFGIHAHGCRPAWEWRTEHR